MIIYCIEGLLMNRRVCVGNIVQSVRTIFVNHSKVSHDIRSYSSIADFKHKFSFNNNYFHLKFLSNHFIDRGYSNKKRNISNISFKSHGSNILGIPLKKRPVRKRKLIFDDGVIPPTGFWNIKALATAEEYDLEGLMKELVIQDLYTPKKISASAKSPANVIHAVPKYQVENEPREMFFFREGTIVMWNTTDLECNNILEMLKNYEENSYLTELLQAESEIMYYTHAESGKRSHLKDGDIYLASESTNLDKYTFSNAISQSVKLGIWESSLDHYIESIEFVTEDLKAGRKIKMTREQVLRKQGELFALRHHINLSSDLLDTPDFYWERDELENLYQQTCGYFAISKRTRVMNEKINHCVELVELLSSHLSDRHHIRLEWMIIVLIMVEVAFELLHYLDRYLEKEELEESPAQRSTAE
ncbi:required for meiotic nuclear division protein 1 homolog [Cotesia glomerata]|uniref:required for meiotic nuclear division protein 1 homolog n=1 Tax=Cotesia glomerata TaxID=32391 RepID=UPI001D017C11|nr:required for meiotic nuclear division protein 1 homolog [Cotesia glomerata]XP_044593688.1 required for meiotic nuclear division protein 1 homolog [Cotesia glomerata]XP_044593689.1 required for meiotic nuclear division protein 1 homolog [Cotesia glomerata]XP_044593690.1 required for meiotic nuclear division protein 1 homolog [Cotesia glomerata]XP_044593691.1 required for meiotic nuclear division protein 1 homolog [Cotesia glomerata]XP_044593692.1 required for meiotic nuclear division protein